VTSGDIVGALVLSVSTRAATMYGVLFAAILVTRVPACTEFAA
jgi:hypothetical protein